MKLNRYQLIVGLLFIVHIVLRLFFAFQTPYFNDNHSYFVLRQVEHITSTGIPLYDDSLSQGGNLFLFMPFFYFLLAFFNLFLPIVLVGKLIPNVLAASLTIIIFHLACKFTNNRKVALFTSAFSLFIPIYFKETFNTVTELTLLLPGSLLFLAYFLELHKKPQHAPIIVMVLVLLVITSPISIILILGMIAYFFLCYLEKIKIYQQEVEFASFSLFFYLWANFILFKKVLQLHGLDIIWLNMPQTILSSFFERPSLSSSLFSIGILPLFFGIYVIYAYTITKKSRRMYLLIGYMAVISIFFLLQLMALNALQLYMGVLLLLLFSRLLKDFFVLFKKSKFSPWSHFVWMIIIFIFLVSSVIPSMNLVSDTLSKAPDPKEINAYLWLKENTPQNSVVLSLPSEGHFITYFAQRRNVMDTNFLPSDRASERLRDVLSLYTSPFKITAHTLFKKYNINYLLITPAAKSKFGEIKYISPECFEKVYANYVTIYRFLNCTPS